MSMTKFDKVAKAAEELMEALAELGEVWDPEYMCLESFATDVSDTVGELREAYEEDIM